MIIGRNTDYPLTGYFDKHPTVIYFTPTDGAHRYMCVTSAGCHNAATGGINEHGLYVTTHTVPASSVSAEGFPVMMVGQQVLREAKNLDEAEALINEAKPAAGWNFHIVSAKERRAATFELSCKKISRVDSEGQWHFTTNHWRDDSMQKHHLFLNSTVETDTRARMARCREMIEEADGQLDAAAAAAILGDKYDRTVDHVRSGPNTVSASTTVSSSVWMPDSGRVFVANGIAPVSQSEYVEVPCLNDFDPETFGDEYEVIDQDKFRREHPAMLESEQIYQQARCAFEYDNDAQRAIALMERAVQTDGTNPALHLHHALYALRANEYATASRACESAIAIEWDGQRRRVALYLRARIAAHRGDATAALRDLREVSGDPECGIRLLAAARKTERSLKRRGKVKLGPGDISPMSWMPDAFRYNGIH